ncbi:DUF4105 domain-containing protein [Dokdonella sp.]|uniref:lipoprotein N-acyltransferase Lnb domain-containing protein n=1 Tax=Dokdonella sp. TaxID=2291710 RepID=UPI001B151EE3|nr:DUF4105 domain-containing protein [Dokdonella sp.]MBO9663719.1 DUF4105 domain-containing protein [Dokdonella sp.]
MRVCLAVLCALAVAHGANAQSSGESDPTQSPITHHPSPLSVSLLTVGPGPIFFERFGHNAIVVRDADGEAVAYNYGIFDFAEGDFLANFARGQMRYRIVAGELADDLAMYRAERREIVEQRLDLSPEQAAALAQFLEWNARPENALYRYDYFLANCSTRVRDALDRALGGALHAQSEGRSRGYTYRLDALRLMAPQPALMLLIDLGLGPFADQRLDYWQESFVPETLRHVVGNAQIAGADGTTKPLVAGSQTLAAGEVEEPPALPPDLRWPFLIGGVALGLALFWLAGRRSAAARVPLALFAIVFELFCAVGGFALLFLWFGSEHVSAWRNENLLLLSPLCLLLLPTWIAALRGRPARRWAHAVAWLVVLGAAFALFSKILPWFVQENLHWIVLFLSLHLALALARGRVAATASIR